MTGWDAPHKPVPMVPRPQAAAEEVPARRLRLLLLTVGLGIGGTEGQILEIATRLNRARFDVSVCALKEGGVVGEELQRQGVRVITLNGSGVWDFRMIPRLYRVIQTERPDIIHAFLFWANLSSRVVGRLLRVSVLISSYRGMDLPRKWPYRLADRWTVKWSRAITCCSDAVRRSVFSHLGGGRERYLTIPNGVDLDRFVQGKLPTKEELGLLQSDTPVIGTVCRLAEPEKGLTILMQAMGQLKSGSATPWFQLLIVGEGQAYGMLRDLRAQLGLSEWVVFCGMRRDIERVLPLMQIFVMPSLSEGFGIAIVEAMAACRPVVATAVGGIPEIVVHGETGLLVPPGDPSALAAAIQDLLSHPAKARSFGHRGRQRVQECFSIQSVVQRHEELYEALYRVGHSDTAATSRDSGH